MIPKKGYDLRKRSVASIHIHPVLTPCAATPRPLAPPSCCRGCTREVSAATWPYELSVWYSVAAGPLACDCFAGVRSTTEHTVQTRQHVVTASGSATLRCALALHLHKTRRVGPPLLEYVMLDFIQR